MRLFLIATALILLLCAAIISSAQSYQPIVGVGDTLNVVSTDIEVLRSIAKLTQGKITLVPVKEGTPIDSTKLVMIVDVTMGVARKKHYPGFFDISVVNRPNYRRSETYFVRTVSARFLLKDPRNGMTRMSGKNEWEIRNKPGEEPLPSDQFDDGLAHALSPLLNPLGRL